MINREIIVIPPGGEDSSLYFKAPVDKDDRHVKPLISYIKDNKIDIETEDIKSIYILSVEMAIKDYVVICTDEYEAVIYLPLTVTQEQLKWFNDYKNVLLKYSVSAASLIEEDNEISVQNIERNNACSSPINRMYKVLKRKQIKEEGIKVKKYGDKK